MAMAIPALVQYTRADGGFSILTPSSHIPMVSSFGDGGMPPGAQSLPDMSASIGV